MTIKEEVLEKLKYENIPKDFEHLGSYYKQEIDKIIDGKIIDLTLNQVLKKIEKFEKKLSDRKKDLTLKEEGAKRRKDKELGEKLLGIHTIKRLELDRIREDFKELKKELGD